MSDFKEDYELTQDDLDNRSDQLNPNNDEYQGEKDKRSPQVIEKVMAYYAKS